MVAFIDAHREVYGVEPICALLPIAPSTTSASRHAARPDRRRRGQRDEALMPEIRRVSTENFAVYGARKVWRQMKREDFVVARCTVERLMRSLGCTVWSAGASAHDDRRRGGAPARSRQPSIPGTVPTNSGSRTSLTWRPGRDSSTPHS